MILKVILLLTNRPERQHEMDRPFEDMIEMAAFDDDGNFMFGRKHAAVQTETFPESKGIDI